MKVTFELNGKCFNKIIEGRDYAHVMQKARRRCQYRKHIYDEHMQIVATGLPRRRRIK